MVTERSDMALLKHAKRKRLLISTRSIKRFRRSTEGLFSSDNRVELFPHGGEFFIALLNACQNAQRFIALEFYLIRDDCAGCSFAEVLRAATSRGVEVLLLYDYVGCFDTPAAYFNRLRQAGVKCVAFNPPSFRRGLAWFDKRDHRKIAIIDGELAFVGGVNIGDEYAGYGENPKRWRDVGVGVRGPSVADLQRLFLENWHGEGGGEAGRADEVRESTPAGDAGVTVVSGGPHHTRSFIRASFRVAIASASSSVKIINPYFVPGVRVLRSLLRAARRGVAVQLVLPAISDVPLVRLVSRGYLSPLLKAGIEVYERQGTVLHAKVMLTDDHWTTIGSANLDLRSFHRNYEVNVTVDSKDFAQQVEKMFAEDLQMSRRITKEEHDARSWSARFLEFLLSPLGRFL
jgi:cardiolipin synthase